MATAAPEARAALLRRGIRLEYFTLGWNVVEAAVALAAGIAASSAALVAFALDSIAESASGAVLLWRLRSETHARDAGELERKAMRRVGIAFLLLAAYVVVDTVVQLSSGSTPDASVVGIALAVVSLVVMPTLASLKRATARRLGSRSLEGDSQQTMLCAYLSGVLLLGLALNAAMGWWWADPVAALAIAAFATREGIELLREEDDR